MHSRFTTALVVTLLVPVVALADAPAYVRELHDQLGNCHPSCYKGESANWGDGQTKPVCGYIDYNFDSMQLRGGKWTPLKWLGESTAAPTALDTCKIPSDSAGSWGAFTKQARASFQPKNGKTTSFVVPPGTTWKYEVDDNLVKHRWLTIRVYSKDYIARPNECASFGDKVCEASGSISARGINYIHYRLDEARKAAEAKDDKMCKVATFAAVATARGLRKFRDAQKKKNEWGTGLTYKTRYDGELDEKGLFGKVDAYENEALNLHVKCGGASPLVTELGPNFQSPENYGLGI